LGSWPGINSFSEATAHAFHTAVLIKKAFQQTPFFSSTLFFLCSFCLLVFALFSFCGLILVLFYFLYKPGGKLIHTTTSPIPSHRLWSSATGKQLHLLEISH